MTDTTILLRIKLLKKILYIHKKTKPRTLFASNHPEAHVRGFTCYDFSVVY